MRALRDEALWLLLALVLVVNVLFMPSTYYPGDPFAMREEARSLLTTGHLAIDPGVVERQYPNADQGKYLVRNPYDGRHYSKYGVMNGLVFSVPLAVERLVEGALPPFKSPRRLLYLNLFNVALSLVAAALLYRIAARFTARRALRVVYVAGVLWASFLWNYLRVQASELPQVVLFAAFYLAWLRLLEERDAAQPARRALWLLWVFVAALTLMRISYLVLAACVGVMDAVDRRVRTGGGWRVVIEGALRSNAVPAAALVVLVGWVNAVKFGSPWHTGYHVWRPEAHGLGGSLLDAGPQLLGSAQWSVFWNFPWLVVALLGGRRFLRAHALRYGAGVLIAVVFFVIIGRLPTWRGELCYGPRYLLFVLPIAALPALAVMERWQDRWDRGLDRALAAVTMAALAWSIFLQVQVNRLPFLTFYRLRAPLEESMPPPAAAYFASHHYGRINWDFVRAGGDPDRLDFWRASRGSYGPEAAASYGGLVKEQLALGNLYFF